MHEFVNHAVITSYNKANDFFIQSVGKKKESNSFLLAHENNNPFANQSWSTYSYPSKRNNSKDLGSDNT